MEFRYFVQLIAVAKAPAVHVGTSQTFRLERRP